MENINRIKILSAEQMRWLDAETMLREPIESIDLMERAANAMCEEILKDFPLNENFAIFCGKGNNGGDGLVIARLLMNLNKTVTVFVANDTSNASPEFKLNFERLKNIANAKILCFQDPFELSSNTICIDAIFGTGLQLPLKQEYSHLIQRINKHFNSIIAIDINSGLPSDLPISPEIDLLVIQSSITYCIASPKLSLLFVETGRFCEKIKVVDIGLSASALSELVAQYYAIGADIMNHLPHRARFDYKQKLGHVLVAAGSLGKSGAAFLCGKSTMEVGAGLVTFACPDDCIIPLQSSFAEAMTLHGLGEAFLAKFNIDIEPFSVLAIGPGLGTNAATVLFIKQLLEQWEKPVVLDADALNCIATLDNFNWPNGAIITPHPGEFDRLTRKHNNSFERLLSQIEYSKKHDIIIVLKGAYTAVSMPNGEVFFNFTGTPAMAKAGSGDTLTGIIAGYLAQGLHPQTAALLSVYIHGRAGELAAATKGIYSTNATDLINSIHLCINQKV